MFEQTWRSPSFLHNLIKRLCRALNTDHRTCTIQYKAFQICHRLSFHHNSFCMSNVSVLSTPLKLLGPSFTLASSNHLRLSIPKLQYLVILAMAAMIVFTHCKDRLIWSELSYKWLRYLQYSLALQIVKWKWRFFCVHKIMQNVKIHAVQSPGLSNILSSHCDL